jgi:ribosomal protein L24E
MNKLKCSSRFCQKELDLNNCYSYISYDGKNVRWCSEKCYLEHIGTVNKQALKGDKND